jgi:oxygen-independent coproporphyrinogen-3 oxidase
MRQSGVEGSGVAGSVYVHFPWCLAKCPYCDFVSYAKAPSTIDHRRYADAVLNELGRREAKAPSRVGSVFFGGGTPSLWDAGELGRVLAGVESALECDGELEVTVECNPTSLDEDRAKALADVGVNRVSIGVQGLDDARLKYLGRLHDSRLAVEVVKGAIRAGVPRVSADLIFGLPEQTPEQACREAMALLDLGLDHLSAYQLTIEAGTRFGELAKRGRLPLADDGAVAESFLALDEAMTARGFVHYEISNYAKPGQEARHNLGYWRGREYLGLGCAAVGFAREKEGAGAHAGAGSATGAKGIRWRNDVSPERYEQGNVGEVLEDLDGEALMKERIMLGLRLAGGVDLDDAQRDLGSPGWTPDREKTTAWLVERGRVVREGSRLRVPREAWLWTDDTAARLF